MTQERDHVPEMTDTNLEDLLNDLMGFGITDNEEIVSIVVGEKTVRVRLSNVSNADEIWALDRAAERKGYSWVQYVRGQILARAITAINGVSVKNVPYIKCPIKGCDRPTSDVLADVLTQTWGQQAVLTLWKLYMLHCENIEQGLLAQLPGSALSTEVERRFMQRVSDELAEVQIASVDEVTDDAEPSEE